MARTLAADQEQPRADGHVTMIADLLCGPVIADLLVGAMIADLHCVPVPPQQLRAALAEWVQGYVAAAAPASAACLHHSNLELHGLISDLVFRFTVYFKVQSISITTNSR